MGLESIDQFKFINSTTSPKFDIRFLIVNQTKNIYDLFSYDGVLGLGRSEFGGFVPFLDILNSSNFTKSNIISIINNTIFTIGS